MDSSVWGAREKEKVDFLIAKLLEPACGVDAVEHADYYYGLLRNRVHHSSLSSIAVLVGLGSRLIRVIQRAKS